MDCESARILLFFYRPGRNTDLAPADVTAVEEHMRGCDACRAVADRSAVTDRAIAPAVQNVAVPPGLKLQLLASAARATRLWWAGRVAAVGAVVGTCVLTAEGVNRLTRPTLDPWAAATAFEAQLAEPTPEVLNWLRREGVPGPLAEEFDFRKVVSFGDTELNGKKVPTLVLVSGQEVCRVQFVRPGAMGTAAATPAQSSGATVRLYRDSPAAGWVTVVTHTGPGLAAFVRPPSPAA